MTTGLSWHELSRAEAKVRAQRAAAKTRTRALTAERQVWLCHGIHPATRARLLDDDSGATCGDCAHLTYRHPSYPKCGLVPITNGERTDIRKSWPACIHWEACQ
jgi:hypothetical protein